MKIQSLDDFAFRYWFYDGEWEEYNTLSDETKTVIMFLAIKFLVDVCCEKGDVLVCNIPNDIRDFLTHMIKHNHITIDNSNLFFTKTRTFQRGNMEGERTIGTDYGMVFVTLPKDKIATIVGMPNIIQNYFDIDLHNNR